VNHWSSVAIAVIFIWIGMVLAISFLEAPLKFRAPGITTQLGLGIGRLVFRALNSCEVAFAIVSLSAVAFGSLTASTVGAITPGVAIGVLVAVSALGVQLVAVRPGLTKYSDGVLAGTTPAREGRSRAHHVYVFLEMVKLLALLAAGVQLLI